MEEANTLAYYEIVTITTVNCFIVEAPGDNFSFLKWLLTQNLSGYIYPLAIPTFIDSPESQTHKLPSYLAIERPTIEHKVAERVSVREWREWRERKKDSGEKEREVVVCGRNFFILECERGRKTEK